MHSLVYSALERQKKILFCTIQRMNNTDFKIKRLVLVGGGHSHLHVLQQLGKQPIPHLQIYFICYSFYKTYNKRLAGYLAGHFSFAESHIDLVALANGSGIKFIHNSLKKINPIEKTITLDNGVEIYYDLLSLNLGSHINLPHQIEPTTAISIKPTTKFFENLDQLIQEIIQRTTVYYLAIIGAEIGAIEIALALHHRVLKELSKNIKALETFQIALFTNEDKILTQLNSRARKIFTTLLQKKGIAVYTNQTVTSIGKNSLICSNKDVFKADKVLFCTQSTSYQWLQDSNLKLDEDGFICVNEYLQSVSFTDIFAVGDIMSMENQKVPKTATCSMKQGVMLFKNIRNYLKGNPLKKYTPRKFYPALVSTGDKYAALIGKYFSIKGRLIWNLKKTLDQQILQKYSDPTVIENKKTTQTVSFFKKDETIVDYSFKKTAAAGEFSSRLLNQSLEKLSQYFPNKYSTFANKKFSTTNSYSIGQKKYLQSIHFLNECLPDSYLFGNLVANHCVSSIYAEGAKPTHAFSIIYLKRAANSIVKDDFEKMLLGAGDFFSKHQVKILGGHSLQGEEENGLGFSVTGNIVENHKTTIEYEQSLVLTKPLGTGSLLLALQQNKIKGSWYENLLQHFLLSNKEAAEMLNKFHYSFCCHIAGQGFLDSIFNNLSPEYSLEIDSRNLPFLDGFEELNYSTEKIDFVGNEISYFKKPLENLNQAQYKACFEPQTCGGFAIILGNKEAINLVNQLQRAGYLQAAIVGKVRLIKNQQKK